MSILVTNKIKKYFGETRAVDRVDLAIETGEVVSLVGPNGAGKTTLIGLISGLLYPDDGKIFFLEHDITSMSPYRRIRVGIARSFQIVNLFDQLTALDNVRLAIFSREGKIKNMATLAESDQGVKKEAYDLLDQFGIKHRTDVLAGSLAEGERKLLDVAVAYALRPKLLLLDEPTSGVSTREKGAIMETVSSVVRSDKTSAVIVEHDMDVVFKYSDRVVVMHQGKILADGPPNEVRADERVRTTFLGGS